MRRFIASEEGSTTLEQLLLIALVAISLLYAMQVFGVATDDSFKGAGTKVKTATGGHKKG